MAKKRLRPKLPAPSSDIHEALSAALQLHQRGKLTQAERAYQRLLIRNEKNAVIHYLLGRLFYQTERKEAGIASMRRALAVQPDFPEALMDLANMLHDVGHSDQAESYLQQLLKLIPNHSMAYNNLGVLLKDQRKFDRAVVAYRRSIELEPNNVAAYCNLAHVLTCIDDLEGAEQAYRQALSIEPDQVDALRCLASVLRRANKTSEASEILSRWLKVEPNNPVASHLLSACSRSAIPARASDEYVRNVFDKFASTFDADLERLNYRGPTIIEQGLVREFGKPDRSRTILDAGCGTGLCAPVLHAYAQRLIGVDISRNMLEVAKQYELYDDLVESELGAFLKVHPAEFDLIVSADTLGYFGDLADFFLWAQAALRPGGLLLATLEVGEIGVEPGYQLQSSGRYCHSREYILRRCQVSGFAVRNLVEVSMRVEAGSPVPAVVLTAQS